MKRILINAQREGELRVALVNNDHLYDLCIESDLSEQKKANIYKGIITRVEPSLEAVFVDYGEEKQGFLPFKDISLNLYPECEGDADKLGDYIKPNQTLIVQIEKEERGNKGASMTTNISLAGQYLILIPYSPKNRSNGVSRSVPMEDRKLIRELLDNLVIPDDVRVIVRTSGSVRNTEELQWNLDYLIKLWGMIQETYEEHKDNNESYLLYREGDAISRTLRDYMKDDIDEVVIDEVETFNKIKKLIHKLMPNLQQRIIHHNHHASLFAHYHVEQQVETVYHRRVSLPSGGEIVIDPTEALISIDVNSGKATKGKDIEETALNTNLEAVAEITRQLRLRDLGGLIVIDFIDMGTTTNRRQVEETLVQLSKDDRAKIKTDRISRFGLLELSRQHIGSPITNLKATKCSECGSTNMVRSIDSQIESILGLIETRASAKGIDQIQVQLPIDSTTYLLNEKRSELHKLESRHGIQVMVIANEHLKHPKYYIRSITYRQSTSEKESYQHKRIETKRNTNTSQAKKKSRKALIDGILPETAPQKKGFFSRLFGHGSTTTTEEEAPKQTTQGKKKYHRPGNSSSNRHRSNTNGRTRNNERPRTSRSRSKSSSPSSP